MPAFLLGFLACTAPETGAGYLAGMPDVYGTRLGLPWTGPNTCIDGTQAAQAALANGWDPSALWYDVHGFTDTTRLRQAWAASAMCVTDVPPLAEDSAAFVAVLTDSVVTKMIYAFNGPDLMAVAARLVREVADQLREDWTESEAAPEWRRDTIRVSVGLQQDGLFNLPLVQMRSHRGCEWLRERFAGSSDSLLAATCW